MIIFFYKRRSPYFCERRRTHRSLGGGGTQLALSLMPRLGFAPQALEEYQT
jgi:hypothetical protein